MYRVSWGIYNQARWSEKDFVTREQLMTWISANWELDAADLEELEQNGSLSIGYDVIYIEEV